MTEATPEGTLVRGAAPPDETGAAPPDKTVHQARPRRPVTAPHGW